MTSAWDRRPSPNRHQVVLIGKRLAEDMDVRGQRGTLLGRLVITQTSDPDNTGRVGAAGCLIREGE